MKTDPPHRHHLCSVGDACLPAPLWSSCLPSPSHRRMSNIVLSNMTVPCDLCLRVSACVCVCVSLAERDVICDRNASEVAKHDCDMSVVCFLGGKDEDTASSLPTFFSRLSSSFDSLGRNATSRPADGSLSSPKPQLSSHLERLGCVYSQKNSALYDFVLFYPWSDDHTTIWMSPHLPDYFSHQPLGFKPRLFLGLDLVFFVCFF